MPQVDNAIVNGVLCYISTARNSHDDDTLLKICQAFYTTEVVVEAKKVLFGVTGEAVVTRRGPGKLRSDISDIVTQFRNLEESNTVLPRFLADSYNSVPPVSGFEVLADHIIGQLTEIGTLKEEVSSLKETVDKIEDSNITDVKEDLHDIKNLLRSCHASHGDHSQLLGDCSRGGMIVHPSSASGVNKSKPVVGKAAQRSNKNNYKNFKQSKNSLSSDISPPSIPVIRDIQPSSRSTSGGLVDLSGGSANENWTVVNRSRKSELIRVERPVEGNLRGVGGTLDLYVGRCDASVNCQILKSYIETEIPIDVVNCKLISKEDIAVKSFKITVAASDREKLLHPSLWPKHVSVRKYFKSRGNGRQ